MDTNSPLRALAAVLLVSAVAHADEPYGQQAATPALIPDHVDPFVGERETFRGAVDRALRQNPQVIIAADELFRAKALLEQVRSQSLPTLTGTGAYIRLDHNRYVNGILALGENQTTANLTLAMNLVSPKTWAAWSHAADQVKVAEKALDDVRRQLAIATGRAYLTILTQRNLVEVSRTARDAARAYDDFAKARFTGGVGNRVDAVRAAQEVATDESQLATALVQLMRSREALGVLLGVETPVDAAEEPNLSEHESVDSELGRINTRADVKAQIVRRDSAHRVTRDSYTDYFPVLSGFAEPFYQNPPQLTVPRTGWQAELILTVPLYDGGLRYGQRKERTALEREADATLEGLIRQARSEVRVAFESVRESDHALQAAEQAAKLAREALDLVSVSYRAGASTNFELIDAQRQSRIADTNAALAEDAARQARLDLLAASGRFPDPR